jgi:murein DD-endopeptidase MepM/ murein hydrolase activator NlpD
MIRPNLRRTAALLGLVSMLCLTAGGPASAETAVSARVRALHRLDARLRRVHRVRFQDAPFPGLLRRMEHLAQAISGEGRDGPGASPQHEQDYVRMAGGVARAGAAERRLQREFRRWVAPLIERRQTLRTWLETFGVLRRCPVEGYTSISDDFGAAVHIPGVPVHRHQGNDIVAPTGSPIVAPFDGYATRVSSDLGGTGVDVTGDQGHVYNAHLSAYGRLGQVSAGDVIGYVGATGDASGSHDHFEWHPNDGPAVDPHSLLMAAC